MKLMKKTCILLGPVFSVLCIACVCERESVGCVGTSVEGFSIYHTECQVVHSLLNQGKYQSKIWRVNTSFRVNTNPFPICLLFLLTSEPLPLIPENMRETLIYKTDNNRPHIIKTDLITGATSMTLIAKSPNCIGLLSSTILLLRTFEVTLPNRMGILRFRIVKHKHNTEPWWKKKRISVSAWQESTGT